MIRGMVLRFNFVVGIKSSTSELAFYVPSEELQVQDPFMRVFGEFNQCYDVRYRSFHLFLLCPNVRDLVFVSLQIRPPLKAKNYSWYIVRGTIIIDFPS